MSILQTTDLKKYYGAEPNITKALDGVTFSIEQGEFVAIVGTSGSGRVKGKELARLNDEQRTLFRRRNIGFIFQNYNLVPVLNVYENIVLADEPTGNLDSRTSSDVLGLLKVTSNKFHQTLVMITHNNEIAQLADRIIRIEDGRIFE